MNVNPFLSTKEAAEKLGVSRSYLEKKRLTGDGPTFLKIGTRVVYDQQDLASWIEGMRKTSTAS